MNEHFRKHTRLALSQIAVLPPALPPVDPLRAQSDLLPELPRLTYRMHDVEGLCIGEIAAVCGARPAQVRRRLERARAMLAAHATR